MQSIENERFKATLGGRFGEGPSGPTPGKTGQVERGTAPFA
jgi:hypothetical protein